MRFVQLPRLTQGQQNSPDFIDFLNRMADAIELVSNITGTPPIDVLVHSGGMCVRYTGPPQVAKVSVSSTVTVDGLYPCTIESYNDGTFYAFITAVTSGTNNPTITTAADHNLTVGQLIFITGVVGAIQVNGPAIVLSTPTSKTLTIQTDLFTTNYTSGGTILSVPSWMPEDATGWVFPPQGEVLLEENYPALLLGTHSDLKPVFTVTAPAVKVRILGADTMLFSNVAVADTGITVSSLLPFMNPSRYILVGAEMMNYTGATFPIASVGSNPLGQLNSLTRGALGTTATTHTIGDWVRSAIYLTAGIGTTDTTISVYNPTASAPEQFLPSQYPYYLYLGNQNAQTGEVIQVQAFISATSAINLQVVRGADGNPAQSWGTNTPVTLWTPYSPTPGDGKFGPWGLRQGAVTVYIPIINTGQWIDIATVFVTPVNTFSNPGAQTPAYFAPLYAGKRYTAILDPSGVPHLTNPPPLYDVQAEWEPPTYISGGGTFSFNFAGFSPTTGNGIRFPLNAGTPSSGTRTDQWTVQLPQSPATNWMVRVDCYIAGAGPLTPPAGSFGAITLWNITTSTNATTFTGTALATETSGIPNTTQSGLLPAINFFAIGFLSSGSSFSVGMQSNYNFANAVDLPTGPLGIVTLIPMATFPIYNPAQLFNPG
jgi:hypothetical protein